MIFNRLVYQDSAALFTIAAFSVAASIFITVCWRALRMGPRQVEKMENLPFDTATPPANHGTEPTSKPAP
jgi:hypothetical protein